MKKYNFDFIQKHFLSCILLFTAIVYARSLFNGFVWDDDLNIVSNNFVHSWSNFPLIFSKQYLTSPLELTGVGRRFIGAGEMSYRPIVTITYFIEYWLFKLNPFGYHLSNLIMHLICGFLSFKLFKYFFSKTIFAGIATAIFLLHPIQTEAVMNISMREDLLVVLFLLSSLLIFIKRYHDHTSHFQTKRMYIAMIVLYGLGLFSKEMMIVLPVLLWGLEVCLKTSYFPNIQLPHAKEFFLKLPQIILRRRYIGFYTMTVFFLLIWFGPMQRETEGWSASYPGGSFWTSLLTMSRVIIIYIQWLINPLKTYATLPPSDDFAITSLFDPLLWIYIPLSGLLFWGLWRWNKLRPQVSLFTLWIVITLLPMMNLIPMPNIMAMRFWYLPMIGLAGLCALLCQTIWEHSGITKIFSRKLLKILFIILLTFYASVIQLHTYRWKDELSFRKDILHFYPDHLYALVGISNTYQQYNAPEKALPYAQKAVDLYPEYQDIHFALSAIYQRIGQPKEAERILKNTTQLFPNDPLSRDELCSFYGRSQNYWATAICLEQVIRDKLQTPKTYYDLMMTYLFLEKKEYAALTGLRAMSQYKNISLERQPD